MITDIKKGSGRNWPTNKKLSNNFNELSIGSLSGVNSKNNSNGFINEFAKLFDLKLDEKNGKLVELNDSNSDKDRIFNIKF